MLAPTPYAPKKISILTPVNKRPTPVAQSNPFLTGDIKSQLISTGRDIKEIDDRVTRELEESKAKNISLDDFYARLDKLKELNPEKDDNDIYKRGLQLATEKGYSVQGLDMQEELSAFGIEDPQTATQKPQEVVSPEQEDSSYLGTVKDTFLASTTGVRNVAGGILGTIPSAAGNTLSTIGKVEEATIGRLTGYMTKAITGKEPIKMSNVFKNLGSEGKKLVQDSLGTDPEAKLTKLSEFGTEVGLLLTPQGQTSLATKFPNLAKDIPKIAEGAKKLQTSAPRLYDAITGILPKVTMGAARGAEETAKYNIISDGEIDKGDIGVGAVLGGTLSGVSPIVTKTEITSKIKNKLGSIMGKLSKGKATSVKAVDKVNDETARGLQIINSRNPGVVISGDSAAKDVAIMAGQTRLSLGKELEKTRGFGGVDMGDTLKWIDDMISYANNPQKLKQASSSVKKEFKALSNLGDLKDISKALENRKTDLVQRLKNNKTSISDLDEYIIGINNNVSSLYNNAGSSGARTSLVIDDAINSKMKQVLDKTISQTTPGGGAEFRALKSQYRDVLNAEKNMANIYSKVSSKKPVSLTDYTDVFIYGNLMEAVATGGTTSAAKAGLQLGIRNKLTSMSDPNNIISDIWKLMEKGKAPMSKQVNANARKNVGIAAASSAIGEGIDKVTE